MTVKNIVRGAYNGTYIVIIDTTLYKQTRDLAQSLLLEGMSHTIPVLETGVYGNLKDRRVENIGVEEFRGRKCMLIEVG
jgi:hypothetical protein